MRIIHLLVSFGFLFIASSGVSQNLKWKEKRSCKRIKNSIIYLASDRLEGRSTGSQGELMSAEYIAGEFVKLGLEPKGEEGYFQIFSVTTLRIADASTELTINNQPTSLFTDFYPLSYSSNKTDVSTGIVRVGFGISDENRNDYKGVDVKGKIALINISSPDGIHPHSKWLAWHGINVRVDEAIKQGASGVFFYRSNEKDAMAESELSLKMKPSEVPVIFLTNVINDTMDLAFAHIKVNILTDSDKGHNVIGFKNNGASKTVVIGAHHDHLGRGEMGGSLAEKTYEVHNGADDNASGIAALIELARQLKKRKSWNSSNNYLFIAFSGEEIGLVGSKYFVKNPTIDLKTVNYMINMDMVGMLNPETKALIINGVGTGSYWKESISRMESLKRGIGTVKTTTGGIGPSDHTSFYLSQIPAIHFFTGTHPHYHKPSDDVENLNLEGEVFVIGYILGMIKDLNPFDSQPFLATTSEDSTARSSGRTSFKVTLGIVPNYTFDGEGLQMDAVREGKPGQKAGMVAGDIIISFHNSAIANIGDYMEFLKKLAPGDVVEIKVRRGDEIISLTAEF
jgi:Peptidase family M28/PDZ domain